MMFLNIIVENGNVWDTDSANLFPGNERVDILWPGHGKDMFDLLVIIGAFPSKRQAKKNWTKTGPEIPLGWNEFVIGKRRRFLCIWNPTPWEDEGEDK